MTGSASHAASHAPDFDLFIVHASADVGFIHEYLLPALDLPRLRVLLVDELPLGGLAVSEIDRGVTRSRYTLAVLSPAYLEDRWAGFGDQLAISLHADRPRVIPLRLRACELPVRLESRIGLDFTDKARWPQETARLRAVLHGELHPPALTRRDPPTRPRQLPWLALAGTIAAGTLLTLAGDRLRPATRPPPPPSADDMARFAATTIQLGMFAADARPRECAALGADEDCAVAADHIAPTYVAAFDLDRLEVTNADYAAWLNANTDLWELSESGVVSTRESSLPLVRVEQCGGGLTLTPHQRVAATARRPVVCVTWHGADAYCRAHGKRLPLEAEWELAAKGADGRAFPWGSDLPRRDGVAFERRGWAIPAPEVVGASAQDVTPERVHDLGGNAAEWVEDRRNNPAIKTLRGGSFASVGVCHLLSSGCARAAPGRHEKDLGFRCARSVIE